MFDTATAITYINRTYAWTAWDYLMGSWQGSETNPDAVHLKPTSIESLSYDTEDLINELDMLLTHGQLSDETRQMVRNALNPLYWTWNADSPFYRTRLAIHLIMISPDYNCTK